MVFSRPGKPVAPRTGETLKSRTGTALRRSADLGMAIGLVFGTQVLVAYVATAGAASSGQFGVITTGYDLSQTTNPIEFDPTQFTSNACCFAYDWPVYAGLLRETTSGAYVPDLASAVTVPSP